MKHEGVCITVKDMSLSKRFYQDLFNLEVFQDYGASVSFGGLSLQQKFDWLAGVPKEDILEKAHNMELYFGEDDLDGFIDRLGQRNDIQYIGDGVEGAGRGQRTARFYDLDGHIIGVGESMKAVVRRFTHSGISMGEISRRMNVSVSDLEKLLQS